MTRRAGSSSGVRRPRGRASTRSSSEDVAEPKPPAVLIAHIDGGARGNPGPAGYGVHIEDEAGGPVAELYGYLGTATNNTAEYAALLALLEYAGSRGVSALRVMSDSELLVRQIRGEYRVKHPALQVLHAAARRLMSSIPSVVLEHVPRELNVEADALANRAMDGRVSSGPLPQALRDLPRTPVQPPLIGE